MIIGDRVFYSGLNGLLYSLDSQSGKVVWKRDLGQRPTTQLSVVGSSLYVGNSTKRLFRISADDGQIQNELPMPAAPEGRILVGEDASLFVFLEDRESRAGYLVSTDFGLSHLRWTRKADRAWSSEWPRLWHGLLLAGNCRGELDAFRVSDGTPQWSDKLKGCLRSVGIDGDEKQIYVGAQEGPVYAYSPPANMDK
jgi:outer membrane protein assembly factor BamB